MSRQRATGFHPGAAGQAAPDPPGFGGGCPCRLSRSERSPSCPSLTASGSSRIHFPQQPSSRARGRPSPPGPNFPSSGGRRAAGAAAATATERGGGSGGARGRAAPAGSGGRRARGWPWPESPRRARRTGRQSPRGSATQTPRRPAWIPPGQPPHPSATQVPQAGARGEGKGGDAGNLAQLPEGLTRRRGDYLRRPSSTLPGDRGHRRRATDTD